MNPSSRYLTREGKDFELAGWSAAKTSFAMRQPSGFLGGLGYPDPEIYPFVDRLNLLPRLVTLQSCAGHRCTPALHCESCADYATFAAGGPGEHMWNGQLWLWPDEQLANWFKFHAPALAALPLIEKVSVMWHVDGKEIIDIQFQGAGHGQLDHAMDQICRFFENGVREAFSW